MPSSSLPIVADLILERLDELMAPFREPDYVHDPASTDNLFRRFFDIIRLATYDEHSTFESALIELLEILEELPEDVRPDTTALGTFSLAVSEFTLNRELVYTRRNADSLSQAAGQASGALRLMREDAANGLLAGNSPTMQNALRDVELANHAYNAAEDAYSAVFARCQYFSLSLALVTFSVGRPSISPS